MLSRTFIYWTAFGNYIFKEKEGDIINNLSDILKSIAGKDNLFIVGDQKQSVYLFRHADKEIFERHAREIQQTGGLEVGLAKNNRCAQNILDSTNKICRELFVTNYADLQPGKKVQTTEPGEAKIVFIAKEPQDDSEDMRKKEARYIAQQFKLLVEQDKDLPQKKKNALLLPKTKQLEFYTSALEAEGLAYTVLSGGAFYLRGEIIDTLNFLQILNNPHDDLKLAAVLRSEMFSISDGALFF